MGRFSLVCCGLHSQHQLRSNNTNFILHSHLDRGLVFRNFEDLRLLALGEAGVQREKESAAGNVAVLLEGRNEGVYLVLSRQEDEDGAVGFFCEVGN